MGILLVAMTVGVVVVGIVLALAAVATGRIWLRNFALGGIGVWLTCYVVLLVGFSFVSEDRELAWNEPKAFCGLYLDCHLHTAVTKVRKARTIRNKTANGEFYIVTVKVFSNAKQATLGFGGLKLHVTDADGRLYPHVPEAEPAEPWFTRPVPAGDGFERDVVFDLPVDVRNPRLDMHDDQSLVEKFLIDDEDSVFHKRTYFKLEDATATARVQ